MGRTSSYSKQIISYLLILSLVFAPSISNAQTVGGWTVNNIAAKGAKAVVSASQNVMINGKEYIKKGTALVAPAASQVSKVLARGAAGYALSVAVEQLLGAVDWVLDPTNNQIKYKEKTTASCTATRCDPTLEKVFIVYGAYGATAEQACSNAGGKWDIKLRPNFPCLSADGKNQSKPAQVANPTYDPQSKPEEEEKTLPLDAVSQQVISNAEGGNTDAQTATVAAAQDIVNDAEKDDAKAAPLVNQFENSATTENADAAEQDAANSATGQTKPNETGGTDLALEFPAFCGWAPTVCQAAQVIISFPQKLEDWYKQSTKAISEAYTYAKEQVQAVRDYFKDEPTKEDDTKLDIPDLPLPDINTDINFGGACPVSKTVPVSFVGISTTIEFSFQPLCDIASFIKPVVITISAFSAALIIAGIRENE